MDREKRSRGAPNVQRQIWLKFSRLMKHQHASKKLSVRVPNPGRKNICVSKGTSCKFHNKIKADLDA